MSLKVTNEVRMDTKRRNGLLLLAVSVAVSLVFLANAVATIGRSVDCNPSSRRCLVETIRAMDPEFLWVLPGIAGITAAAGVSLIRSANREPPPRALGFTWEQW